MALDKETTEYVKAEIAKAMKDFQSKNSFTSFQNRDKGTHSYLGRQSVTGAKGGNAALTSLLTALATLGLIIDSTT